MKTINVTDTFKVEIDKYGNHQPVYFNRGGELIEKGKYKGGLTKPRWIEESKYFNNLAKAIHYGVEQGILSDLEMSGDFTVGEYLKQLESIYDTTKSLLDGV